MTDYDTIYREGYEEGVSEMKAEMEKMKAEMEKMKAEMEKLKKENERNEESDEDEEEGVPRCDFCNVKEEDIRYYQGGDMWNGDTGCCVACEEKHS